MKEQNHISLPPKCLISLSTLYLYKSSLYRQKIIAQNEEIYDERFGRSTSVTIYEHNSDTLEDGGNETQESRGEELVSMTKDVRNQRC